MYRYVIAFILINIYYPSNGLPLHANATHMSIANRLQNLANVCENLFISELIKRQIDLCNVSESTDKKTEFKCLMFYDINTQLCTVFRRSKFNLKDSYATEMSQIQDIKNTCDHARTWQFANKESFPKNEPVDQVFKNEIFCIQMCSVDQFLSADSNFFCKYYQWGTEVIQTVAAGTTQQNSEVSVPVLPDSIVNPIGNNTAITNVHKTDNSTTSTNESAVKPIETKLVVSKGELQKNEISNPDLSGQTSTINQLSAVNNVQKPQVLANAPKITDQSVVPAETASKNEMEKPPVEEEPPKKDEVEKDTSVQKDSVIENPKVKQPVVDIDEDQEDENEDDAEYVQGSDQDDAGLKPMESDPNIDIKKPKDSIGAIVMSDQNAFNVQLLDSEPNVGVKLHKGRAGMESITSISETFPNSMQDNFEEDDDHFFPFFVTAIIIVVLLYILYHNKNKFTKVILGLLVEGRQTGRRRNSRGHAYRRLDTLEQAMNTNTAAPPSKIIY